MYLWNDISIKVHGNNSTFIHKVAKYINAPFVSNVNSAADIDVLVSEDTSDFPEISVSARLVRTIEYAEDFNTTLNIYNNGQCLWYIYKGIAEIFLDGSKNKMVILLRGLPLEFEYYNILIFLFHPLGYLLEKFGFYRIHSSCCTIGEKSFLATGTSGSGKSTSAFTSFYFGGWIISDDLTYIKKEKGKYLAYSLSALVKLRNDSITRFFPELESLEPVFKYNDETYFYIPDINRQHIPKNEIFGVGILNKTGGFKSSYCTAKPIDIIPKMFPGTLNVNITEHAVSKFSFLTDMLNDLPCFKIDFGTNMESYYNQVKEILGAIDIG